MAEMIDFGCSFATVVTGPVVKVSGSFAPALIVGAAGPVVVYLVLVRSLIPVESLEG
jgi:hypothetical protein